MKKVLQRVAIFFVSISLFSHCIVVASENHDGTQSLADVISKLSPSVVNISTTQEVKSDVRNTNEQQWEFFQKFFQHEFGDKEFDLGEELFNKPSKVYSLGSGFLVDSEGHIVTNEHVIGQADEINITIGVDESKIYKAKVVGNDKRTDLALLKIDIKEKLPFVGFGDSDSIRVGDDVIAIGNAFGFGGSVTKGIVSAKGRNLGGNFFEDFLQTDASINKGNSGGPMLNMRGEVVGVNTAILSPTGGNIGIGFAIPSNVVKDIINQLKATGKVKRGWLGVKFQPVTPSMAKALNVPEGTKGAIVNKVYENSPAAKASLKIGDFIYEFNGEELSHLNDLAKFVSHADTGKEITLGMIREGKKKFIKVTLEEPKVEDPFSEAGVTTTAIKVAGLYIVSVNNESKHRFHIPDDINGGAVIVKKNKQSNLRKLHLGDVVVSIINKGYTHKITSPLIFNNILASILQEKKQAVIFRVIRKGVPLYVEVEFGSEK